MQTRTISTNAAIDLVDEVILGTRERDAESLIGATAPSATLPSLFQTQTYRKRVQARVGYDGLDPGLWLSALSLTATQ
jgi:hypothetical protein